MIQRHNMENYKAALLNYYYYKKNKTTANQETTTKNPTPKPTKQKAVIFCPAELREKPLHLLR